MDARGEEMMKGEGERRRDEERCGWRGSDEDADSSNERRE